VDEREATEALFDTAIEIAQTPRLRGNLSGLRRRLIDVTNQIKKGGEPDWYNRAEDLRAQLIEILSQHLMRVEDQPEFRGRPDLLAIMYGQVPEHLETWNREWESKIVPKIKALRK